MCVITSVRVRNPLQKVPSFMHCAGADFIYYINDSSLVPDLTNYLIRSGWPLPKTFDDSLLIHAICLPHDDI